jgi:hypothetical protein
MFHKSKAQRDITLVHKKYTRKRLKEEKKTKKTKRQQRTQGTQNRPIITHHPT